MTRTRIALAACLASLLCLAGPTTSGQMRVRPVTDQQGTVALQLALRQLRTVGTFLMATAHPDDEQNGTLAMLGLGQGMRCVLVSATRGDGGQNEIGPELFDALAVLRTEELRAAHRFDGAEQYFTRAVDFGFSFSIDETFARWGREEIVGDLVRLIRTVRPDVVTGFIWEGTGGGQHHQAISRLTAEAFRAAADAAKYPEQIASGLRPWQARKYYYLAGFSMRGAPQGTPGRSVTVDANVYDPVLGRTYAEIGTEARSMHKCQGTSQLLLLPGAPYAMRYRLHDTELPGQLDKDEATLFDGLDVSLASLAGFAAPNPPADLVAGIDAMGRSVDAAQQALDAHGPAAAAAPLADGLRAVRDLRSRLATLGLGEGAAYEIGFRLARKQQQFERAVVLAHGVRVEALADDGVVVAGQPVKVHLVAAAMSAEGAAIRGVHVSGLDAPADTCKPGETARARAYACEVTARIPADATPSTPYFRRREDFDRYDFDADAPFGLPSRPTPYRVAVDLTLSGVELTLEAEVRYRYDGAALSGEKRMELQVVPVMAARVSPDIAIIPREPAGAGGARRPSGREVRVTVTSGTRGPAKADVALAVPPGWTVSPSSSPVSFAREDEEVTVRFTVRPPAGVSAGLYTVKARVTSGAASFDQGYQVVEYAHTERRHVLHPAEVAIKVLDVRTVPDVRVGYVMGVGDQVPPALVQLGARVTLLDADELAWGDLSAYDVIMTGVRAYERRADLRANNQRLLDYAERGGTVIVQYNKFEFNEAQYGPLPAKVSANRVTDERAPVRVLLPDHPVFTRPNRIGPSTWEGWVQERGLYFLGERDPKYVDLVESEDPFEFNKGPKRGALVEARVGSGRWLYVGLGLWRQLPAGTSGAYELMANLIGLGRRPAARPRR